jgi:hypothetical protein
MNNGPTLDLEDILENPADLAGKLFGVAMPKYDGPEPTEIDIARIRKLIDEGRFDALPKEQQRWVTRRLMPSLARFGCYPPPDQ